MIMKFKKTSHSYFIIIPLLLLLGSGCSSSSPKPADAMLANLSTKGVDTPADEVAPAKEPEKEAPKKPEEKKEAPTGPVCISLWQSLPELGSIPGISSIQKIMNNGSATFRATADGKTYRLVNSNNLISIATPDNGTHNIKEICKQPDGSIVATALGPMGMSIPVTMQPKGGKAYNIKFLHHSVDAEVVE